MHRVCQNEHSEACSYQSVLYHNQVGAVEFNSLPSAFAPLPSILEEGDEQQPAPGAEPDVAAAPAPAQAAAPVTATSPAASPVPTEAHVTTRVIVHHDRVVVRDSNGLAASGNALRQEIIALRHAQGQERAFMDTQLSELRSELADSARERARVAADLAAVLAVPPGTEVPTEVDGVSLDEVPSLEELVEVLEDTIGHDAAIAELSAPVLQDFEAAATTPKAATSTKRKAATSASQQPPFRVALRAFKRWKWALRKIVFLIRMRVGFQDASALRRGVTHTLCDPLVQPKDVKRQRLKKKQTLAGRLENLEKRTRSTAESLAKREKMLNEIAQVRRDEVGGKAGSSISLIASHSHTRSVASDCCVVCRQTWQVLWPTWAR